MERWPAIERGAYEPQARLSIWLKDLVRFLAHLVVV